LDHAHYLRPRRQCLRHRPPHSMKNLTEKSIMFRPHEYAGVHRV
jgi:hypothetical protein